MRSRSQLLSLVLLVFLLLAVGTPSSAPPKSSGIRQNAGALGSPRESPLAAAHFFAKQARCYNSPDILQWMAGYSLDAGRKDEALVLLAEALDRADPQAAYHPGYAPSERNPYVDIAIKYGQAGRHDVALSILSESRRAAHAGSKWEESSELRHVVRGYAQIGELDKALKVSKTIREWSDRDLAWSDLGRAMARAGRFKTALSLVGHMRFMKERVAVLSAVGVAQHKARRIDDSVAVLARAAKLAATSYHGRHYKARANPFLMIHVARAYLDTGRKQAGLQMLSGAVSVIRARDYPGDKANAWLETSRTYLRASEKEGAITGLAQALSATPPYDERILISIARTYVSVGKRATGLRLLDEVRYSTDARFRLVELAEAYAEAGRRKEASELLLDALREAGNVGPYTHYLAGNLARIGMAYERTGIRVDERARKVLRYILAHPPTGIQGFARSAPPTDSAVRGFLEAAIPEPASRLRENPADIRSDLSY